jgi:hypothetical protein
MFFPCHQDTLGAALVPEAVDRSSRNIWRPFAVMVLASELWQHYEQHYHKILVSKHTGASTT